MLSLVRVFGAAGLAGVLLASGAVSPVATSSFELYLGMLRYPWMWFLRMLLITISTLCWSSPG